MNGIPSTASAGSELLEPRITNEQPTRALALTTLACALITRTGARWAFNPVILPDGALIRSRASLSASHAATLPIGYLYGMAGRSTVCARRDWLRALHEVG
jgi:hypothetical protein